MCGIAGWLTGPKSKWRPSKELIRDLLIANVMRGRDATGYGTLTNEGDLFMYKGALTAHEFCEEFMVEDVPIGRVGILHTRGASVGTPAVNTNNHPLPYENPKTKVGVLVVHNGGIGNLEEAYKALGVDKEAEVDSALIPTALAMKGPIEGLRFLEKNTGGSATFAALFSDGSLLLARESNTLYLGSPAPGVLLWSSTDDVIRKVCTVSEFGVQLTRTAIPQDRSFIYFRPDGTTETGSFLLPVSYNSPARWERYPYFHSVKPAGPAVTEERRSLPPSPIALGATSTAMSDTDRLPSHYRESKRSQGAVIELSSALNLACFWGGCWKRGRFSVSYGGNFRVLCERHKKRVVKQGHTIVTPSKEELRKKEAQNDAATAAAATA